MRLALLIAGALAPPARAEQGDAAPPNRSAGGWNLRRRYVVAPDGESLEEDQVRLKFRILSWNTLAPSWTNLNKRNRWLHADLDWAARLPRIIHEIQVKAPSILVLQEVEELAYHRDLLPLLTAMGYQGLFSVSLQTMVGVAVLWKWEQFFLSSAEETNLGHPFQSKWNLSMPSLSEQQRERYLVLSANRVAIFALLVPRVLGVSRSSSRHAVLVCAAHLSSIVHELPTGMDLQIFQALLLMEAIESIVKQQAEKRITVNVVVAADMNAPPSYPPSVLAALSRKAHGKDAVLQHDGDTVPSPVYDLFTQGFLTHTSIGLVVLTIKAAGLQPSALLFKEFREMMGTDWHEYAMASAYAKALGAEPVTCRGKEDERADYVFFLPGRRLARLSLLGVLAPPLNLDYGELIRSIGSDHAPLVCDFALVAAPTRASGAAAKRRSTAKRTRR